MVESIINKILSNKEIFFKNEIKCINENKEIFSLVYIIAILDIVKIIKGSD